jgi:Transposase DDE domain group 1
VRRKKADLKCRVNGILNLVFGSEELSSYAGLEIIRCFLQQVHFSRRLRAHLGKHDLRGDFSAVSVVRAVLALLLTGGRRLHHIGFLQSDPLVSRFCSLTALPTDRTVSRWLGQCTIAVQDSLREFQAELLCESVQPLDLRRLTLDIDGTVISTGLTVERAFRGYNPHHRRVPSYFPLTAHLAQTGHILRVQNRSGNTHDGKGAKEFIRKVLVDARDMAPGATLEMRLDGAYFREDLLSWLPRHVEYAVKVPFYKWLGLKNIIQNRKRWKRVTKELEGFEICLPVDCWGLNLRVGIYRKKVMHKSPKNYQLDLFDPDDGYWEYSAIATNKSVGLRALWEFMAGRGSHEKALSELKTGYAFDTVPTHDYAANSTWQILSAMAHNIMVSLQIATGAQRRRQNAKRGPLFLLKRIGTMRFEWLCRAGLIQNPNGRRTMKMSSNLPARNAIQNLVDHLHAA